MSLNQPPAFAPPQPSLGDMAPLASTGQRFAARLLDSIVLGVLWFVALVATGVMGTALENAEEGNPYSDIPVGPTMLALVLTFVVYFLYEGFMLSRSGQTLGKKAVGIRVAVLANGNIPSREGWIRAAVYALPGVAQMLLNLGTIFWLLNSLWFLWDKPYRQCLHDKAAKTVVVRA
ncbi:RDD family protein [Streptomyces boninensis]|uniref:RDD family protein n=1 Tax=Streptomyces boninensis TaxID=2039455 RepID=UPI003B224F42